MNMTNDELRVLRHLLNNVYDIVGKVKEVAPNLAIDIDIRVSDGLERLISGDMRMLLVMSGLGEGPSIERYKVQEFDSETFHVVDTETGWELAVCSNYDALEPEFRLEDGRKRARAIAGMMNATGFDYKPE